MGVTVNNVDQFARSSDKTAVSTSIDVPFGATVEAIVPLFAHFLPASGIPVAIQVEDCLVTSVASTAKPR
jgi:hypothetical protein